MLSDLPNKLTKLDYWSEIIGPYMGSYRIDSLTYFQIGTRTLAFNNNSREIEILTKKLKNQRVIQIIGILRTDSLEIPLVIRFLKGD